MCETPAIKPLLRVLAGECRSIPPVWLMRQAGRYLPEYRIIREKAGSFLDLCLNPKLAAEATLQPIRRFGFDAAILFSDILMVPYALGQHVMFEDGKGPKLDALAEPLDFQRLRRQIDHGMIAPIYEAIIRVKEELPCEVTLLGFCGAPWTVATYMVGGRASSDHLAVRIFAYRHPQLFAELVDLLVEASVEYLIRQFHAGVEAAQLFDTWAGVLSDDEFQRWCLEPAARIVRAVREHIPTARMISFPRGVGTQLEQYLATVPVDALALDSTINLRFARERIQIRRAIQGNLDPLVLLLGGEVLDHAVDAVLEAFGQGPFIFNLGHGVLPDTPIAHVEQLLARIRRTRTNGRSV